MYLRACPPKLSNYIIWIISVTYCQKYVILEYRHTDWILILHLWSFDSQTPGSWVDWSSSYTHCVLHKIWIFSVTYGRKYVILEYRHTNWIMILDLLWFGSQTPGSWDNWSLSYRHWLLHKIWIISVKYCRKYVYLEYRHTNKAHILDLDQS